jgi:hypothetical protein
VTHLIVPHVPGTTDVAVWIGAFLDAPGSLDLELDGRRIPLGNGWKAWRGRDEPAAWSQSVTVDGLRPGTHYAVRLLEGSAERASASVATLPDELPPLGAQPFICLVGSCFAYLSDAAGAAGAAYAALPAGARPDVKFLCGDQVYLDAPFPRYLYNLYRDDALRAELLGTYVATWTQGGDRRGFSEVLRDGATFFSSDDHEVWNNAPMPTATVRATWWPFGDHGAAWLRMATELFDGFQSSTRSASFKVGRLSVRVLDTRLARMRDRSQFVAPRELAGLGAWVDALEGPGALVIGQPIFAEPAGWRGNFTDWGLADYDQYADLVRILMRARHDLLVLTGDVHFGRVSGCTLPSGASLVEVIASPFALVDPRVGGHWRPPPPVFPALPVAGVTQAAIWHNDAHRLATNQFATLEFSADGSRVLTSVKSWPIPPLGRAPTSTLVFQKPLS